MRLVSALFLAFVCYAPVQSSAGTDYLRCGSALIEPGDSAAYTLEKCGVPTSTTTMPVWERDTNGTSYMFINARSDVWRYELGPGKFPAQVRIVDGVVDSITFETHREE
jgi:Protein of unknown function (DUF2845)